MNRRSFLKTVSGFFSGLIVGIRPDLSSPSLVPLDQFREGRRSQVAQLAQPDAQLYVWRATAEFLGSTPSIDQVVNFYVTQSLSDDDFAATLDNARYIGSAIPEDEKGLVKASGQFAVHPGKPLAVLAEIDVINAQLDDLDFELIPIHHEIM